MTRPTLASNHRFGISEYIKIVSTSLVGHYKKMDSENFTIASPPLNWFSSSPESANDTIGGLSFYQRYSIYLPSIFLIKLGCVPFWMAIGIPGNVLSFVVWSRPSMRASSGCILAALSVTDCVFLVLRLLYELQETWRFTVLEVCLSQQIMKISHQYNLYKISYLNSHDNLAC
jgi:hypothetical protein